MSIGAAVMSVPLALGGESAGGESTGIAVISVVSIVAGYLLIAALWYFVFRDPSRARRKRNRSD
jgi:peptidoglycan/LPS O-acetylase OafA/YrhL